MCVHSWQLDKVADGGLGGGTYIQPMHTCQRFSGCEGRRLYRMFYAMLNLDKLWTIIMIGGNDLHQVMGGVHIERLRSHIPCVCMIII